MHASLDIVAAYREISRGAQTVGDYLASFRKSMAFANFALDDPLPAIVELPVQAWYRLANGPDRRFKIHGAKECANGVPAAR
jgi:predicted ATP-grasp superfamily ATP-dependent carboligase